MLVGTLKLDRFELVGDRWWCGPTFAAIRPHGVRQLILVNSAGYLSEWGQGAMADALRSAGADRRNCQLLAALAAAGPPGLCDGTVAGEIDRRLDQGTLAPLQSHWEDRMNG